MVRSVVGQLDFQNLVRFTDSRRNVNLKLKSGNGATLTCKKPNESHYLPASPPINVQASLSRVFRRPRPDDEENFCRQSQALRSQTGPDPQTFDMPATAIV
jgi:hypothetical protein